MTDTKSLLAQAVEVGERAWSAIHEADRTGIYFEDIPGVRLNVLTPSEKSKQEKLMLAARFLDSRRMAANELMIELEIPVKDWRLSSTTLRFDSAATVTEKSL